MKKKEVAVVVQSQEKPIERNVLAQAIVDISKSMKKLLASGLNRDAIIVLVHARVKPTFTNGPKPNRGEIEAVFNALAQLEKDFCK